MSHLLGCLSTALNTDQFVIAPECAVEEQDVGGVELLEQRVVDLGDRGQVGKTFAGGRFDDQAQRGFSGCQFRLALGGNVCGKVRSQRERAATQSRVLASWVEQ